MNQALINQVTSALAFSGIGIVMLGIAFFVLDLVTPQFKLWVEIIEKQNMALAILLGSFTIGLGLIIAAAVHG
jgi:putative membrane protein